MYEQTNKWKRKQIQMNEANKCANDQINGF